jgi:hypothetical protein
MSEGFDRLIQLDDRARPIAQDLAALTRAARVPLIDARELASERPPDVIIDFEQRNSSQPVATIEIAQHIAEQLFVTALPILDQVGDVVHRVH